MNTEKVLVALAGQPNCGKSTVFNALTGASQHVANYPGVTVDKMTGWFRHDGCKYEIVDLPGTYSMTSYSPEERVTRDFLLQDRPAVTVNVMDASNLNRCLYFTLQLLEMEIPIMLNLNMMDVAEKRNLRIDEKKVSGRLGIPVVPTSMRRKQGKPALLDAIVSVARNGGASQNAKIDYAEMEPYLQEIIERLNGYGGLKDRFALRWLAVKLMEDDEEARKLIRNHIPDADALFDQVREKRESFQERYGKAPEVHIADYRYRAANAIAFDSVTHTKDKQRPFSDKVDGWLCHRFFGPVFMVGVIWMLYYLSIVQGYNITNYTWPFLAKIRSFTEAVMPAPGFIEIPLIRAFALWFVDSLIALLNYIPIFLILFSLIAILEDSGYMPRMAFIMDRLFSRFGLHGQSTLPMVLGGVYVGGCAVPAVMSCKGIPDERSRMATILIIPMLNCLAKVPLYVLLINIYFAAHKAWAMFFISTISLLLVLPVSKLFTLTILKKKETAPFVMEMPPYHMPTLQGVLGKAFQRVWLFIRKITTIVAAVAVVIFVLLQFPGIGEERLQDYHARKDKVIADFLKGVKKTQYADKIDKDSLPALMQYWEDYKTAKMGISGQDAAGALNARFEKENPVFFRIVQPGNDPDAKQINRKFKNLVKTRKQLLREMQKERIDNSFLGTAGKWLEPVTHGAGFTWRVNVALLAALAAKESSVATLGALYEQEEEGATLEQRMAAGEEGFTPLHALALMLFMVLYPPCVATAIAVKLQAGSAKWMMFSMVYPMVLGLAVATMVFSIGSALDLSGLQAMFAFYGLALAVTVLMGLIPDKTRYATT
ncbi:MAG: ferrous iron transport protein B [Pseudomonadota bacterium]